MCVCVCDLTAEHSGIRRSIVGTATCIRVRRLGIRNPVVENGFFSSPKCPHRLGGPTSFILIGYRCSFLRMYPSAHDADHLPPCSAEVILNGAVLRSVHAQFSILFHKIPPSFRICHCDIPIEIYSTFLRVHFAPH